ncbi:MAG: type II toxin-antitoxin system PemK/MazF family toxin [Deltaproteobacteria bacterium]|nr:type II toxin-antitoxin system PemK/MazF family toxin [Deltaproteobacteria bacterium]
MERGEVWWASLPEPDGSEPGGRRPVLVIQANAFNKSSIRTVIVASLTTRFERASAPGNVLVTSKQSGLRRDSVIDVSEILTIDRRALTEKVGNAPAKIMGQVDDGLRRVIGL